MRRALLVPIVSFVTISGLIMGEEPVQDAGSHLPTCMPELGVAVAVDNRTIEVRRFVDRTVVRRSLEDASDGGNVKVDKGILELSPRTETAVIQEEHSMRLPANSVAAQRIDGSVVPNAVMLQELSRPKCVLVLKGDRQLSPLVADVFAADALVLRFGLATSSTSAVPTLREPSTRQKR